MQNAERYPFLSINSALGEAGFQPRLPLTLAYHDRAIAVTGVLDTGAMVNVLPYAVGVDLVPHPLLILGYSRFNFVRASSILNCQSTPRCLALVLSAQSPISDWSKGSSPMRRSVRH